VVKMQQDDLLKYNRLNGAVYKARFAGGPMEKVPSRLVEIPEPGEDANPW